MKKPLVGALMKGEYKTKEQLINELAALRQGISQLAYEKAEHARLEEALEKSVEEFHYLYAHIQSAIEGERRSIAREIHDELGQMLTAMKMDLSWLSKRQEKWGTSTIKKVREMAFLVDDTILKVQRIATELRPGILDDLGIVAALEYAIEEFQQRSGINCRLNAEPENLDLDPETATGIFRIFQEALTNISRHAEATSVSVSLKKKGNWLLMQLKDNGIGIREEQTSGKHSFGLIGMRERASLLGGKLQIKGIPGKGTTITLSAPFDTGKVDNNTNYR